MFSKLRGHSIYRLVSDVLANVQLLSSNLKMSYIIKNTFKDLINLI